MIFLNNRITACWTTIIFFLRYVVPPVKKTCDRRRESCYTEPIRGSQVCIFLSGGGGKLFYGRNWLLLFLFSMKVTVLINNPPVLGMLSLCCNFTLWWYIKCGLSSVLEFCILQIPPLCSQHHTNYLEKFCYIYAFICDWNGISSRS